VRVHGLGWVVLIDIDSHLCHKNKWVLPARCTAGAEKRSASLHMTILGGCVVVLSTLLKLINSTAVLSVIKLMNLFIFILLLVSHFLSLVLIALNLNF
jgi:hypothetical protein